MLRVRLGESDFHKGVDWVGDRRPDESRRREEAKREWKIMSDAAHTASLSLIAVEENQH